MFVESYWYVWREPTFATRNPSDSGLLSESRRKYEQASVRRCSQLFVSSLGLLLSAKPFWKNFDRFVNKFFSHMIYIYIFFSESFDYSWSVIDTGIIKVVKIVSLHFLGILKISKSPSSSVAILLSKITPLAILFYCWYVHTSIECEKFNFIKLWWNQICSIWTTSERSVHRF